MKVVRLRDDNIKLIADEGRIIKSKVKCIDEEKDEMVLDVMGCVVYLGKNDSEENYIEVEMAKEEG